MLKEQNAEEKPAAPCKRTRRLGADITRVVEHELVPNEVLAAPDACVRLEEKEVQTSQRLEFVPAHTMLHVYLRPAYVRKDGRGAPLRAAAPAGEEEVVFDFYRTMHAELLESPALHVDETPVRRLKGANKNGYMWVMSSADTASSLYLWSESRAAAALDTLLREGKAPPGEILRTRKETAAQIVENLFQKLQGKLADTANPPLNKLREAIDYAPKRRDTLKSWLANPGLPIDNNTVERAVHPVTAGRKNYIFIGAPETGQPHPAASRPRQGVPPVGTPAYTTPVCRAAGYKSAPLWKNMPPPGHTLQKPHNTGNCKKRDYGS